MNKLAKLLAGIAWVVGCSAAIPAPPGEGADDGSNPIIGGTKDSGDPSVVLMKASSGNIGWWCTGSVIAKRLVLTAAHCVEDATAGTTMQVMFGGDESTAKPSDYIAVKEWHHDPQYMATNNIAAGHDAAVLILADDAPCSPLFINHTPLTDAMIGNAVHVVGFGNDNGAQGTGAGVKREIHTTLTSLEQGVANIGHSGQTTCQGDSGGPSFMNIGGSDVIIGITSYGEAGCVDYGSVTRVDLSAPWIDPYIAANGGNGGNPVCTPSCSGRACGDDGCGGTCGSCSGTSTCSAAGQCVAPPPDNGGCQNGQGNETEPNNNKAGANQLCNNQISGTIASPSDSDWYTWKVAAHSTYTVNLATSHEFVMTLYKVSGKSLVEITSAFDQIQRTTPDGGTYYLEVWGGNGDYSPKDPYSVSLAVQ